MRKYPTNSINIATKFLVAITLSFGFVNQLHAATLTASDCVIQANQSTCASTVSYSEATSAQLYIVNTTRNVGRYFTGSLSSSNLYAPRQDVYSGQIDDYVNNLTYGRNTISVKYSPSDNASIASATPNATCAPGTTWIGGKCFDGTVQQNTSSGSINFGFQGCIVPINGSYCNMPEQNNVSALQAKNTTGVPLIVRQKENDVLTLNLWNIGHGIDEVEPNYSKLIIPTQNGSTAGLPSNYVTTATTHKVSFNPRLIPGANTLVVTKLDGTVVDTEVVYATCESGSVWVPAQNPKFEYAQGKCVSQNQSGSIQQPLESVSADNCIIKLGDMSCFTKIYIKSYANRQLDLDFINDDFVLGFSGDVKNFSGRLSSTNRSLRFSESLASGNYNGTFPYSNGQYVLDFSSSLSPSDLFTGTRYGSLDALLYGKNTIDVYDNGKKVGSTTANATCASGLFWTAIKPFPTEEINRFACLPAAPNGIISGNLQTIVTKSSTRDFRQDPTFGLVDGFCLPGEKWQQVTTVVNIVGGTTRTDVEYKCAPTSGSVVTSSNTSYNQSPSLPVGCTTSTGYSPTTGVRCDTVLQSSNTNVFLPVGCTSTTAYSPTTGQKCVSGFYTQPVEPKNSDNQALAANSIAYNYSAYGVSTNTTPTYNSNNVNTSSSLQGDIDPNSTSSTGMCLNLTANLRQGMSSSDVGRLQDFLISKGYLNSESTGYFGTLTFSAVQKYQSAQNFINSGYVGPLTRGAIAGETCTR